MGTRPPEIAGLTQWRPLARGGFAMVWQARQTTLDRWVAVKVDERQLDTESERRRFLREAGAAGRMSGHAGIVTVHDAGILPDHRPYLVMELCPGGSLNSWVKREGPPTPAAVVDIGTRIADALSAAHEVGVVHRDVKPANILIDAYGNAGLADFGLATIPEPDASPAEAMDALTPAYAAPEVLMGEPATPAGDVYALAASLYTLLAGHAPRWTGPQIPTAAQVEQRWGEPIAPIDDVPPELMAVLSGALADEPMARPTAAGFRDQLAAVGRRLAPDAEPPVRRRSARSWVVLVAVVVVLAGLVAVLAVRFLGADPGAAVPPVVVPSTSSPAATTSTPTPTPTPLPANFVDCSNAVGAPALCPVKPECWTQLFAYMYSPYQAVSQDCAKPHVYQTFAAVQLDYTPRRQPQIDADPTVKAVCNRAVMAKMVRGVTTDRSWELKVIPPQFEDDTVYRCIFGKGERSGALRLRR